MFWLHAFGYLVAIGIGFWLGISFDKAIPELKDKAKRVTEALK